MNEDLNSSMQRLLECPFSSIGCGSEGAPKHIMLTHLKDDKLTHSQLLIDLVNNMKNEMGELKNNFKKELEIKNVQIGELERKLSEQMEGNHQTEISNQKSEIVELKREIDRIKEHSVRREIMMKEEMRESERNIKNTVETSERESTKYRDETRSTLTKMREETDTRESAVIKLMNDVREEFDKLSVTVERVKNAVCTNTIALTVDKIRARMTTNGKILSPYFYSHTNGYKLQLQVYPGGYSGGRGTHLSVYIHTYQGEYDDVLPWPCRHTFTLSITNQYDGVAYASETFNFENTESHLSNQIKGENYGLEGPKFVSHEYLKSVDGLIVKDNVIVRCVVNGPL